MAGSGAVRVLAAAAVVAAAAAAQLRAPPAAPAPPAVGDGPFMASVSQASVAAGATVTVAWGCVGCPGNMLRVWAINTATAAMYSVVNATGITTYVWTVPTDGSVVVGASYKVRVAMDGGGSSSATTPLLITPPSPTGGIVVGTNGVAPSVVSLRDVGAAFNLTFACAGDVTAVNVFTPAGVQVAGPLSCAAPPPAVVPVVPAMYNASAAGGVQFTVAATNGNAAEYALTFPVAVLPPTTITVLTPAANGTAPPVLHQGAPLNISWVMDIPGAAAMGITVVPGGVGWPRYYGINVYYADTQSMAFQLYINFPWSCAALPCAAWWATDVPMAFPFTSLYYIEVESTQYAAAINNRSVDVVIENYPVPSWSPSPVPAAPMTPGAIAGASVGAVGGVAALAALFVCFRRRRAGAQAPTPAGSVGAPPAPFQTAAYSKLG